MSFRMLHWVHKIGNYSKSKQFYEKELNMVEQRHESFDAGCEAACNGRYNLSWTKTMIGYGPEDLHFVLELTANHGIKSYKLGNDFREIVIHHDKAAESKQTIVDPNGYTYVLVNRERDLEESERNSFEHDQVQYISLHTKNLEKQIQFYTQVLGMQVFKRGENRALLGFAQDQAKIEFVQLSESEELIHGEAFGRLAISSKVDIKEMHQKVLKAKEEEVFVSTGISIVKEPIVLPTPGKADVEVVIISDCDGYEICLAEETGFLALALGK
ncbi:hypothetical protein NAEGRDRAFT_80346 [Naegleria gruberi]|uniref:Uncharacterized protein FM150 n=1 Tax=Naegleria gruberi TaxID=5762 RepID=D2VKR8_NAEGR|nr:uncharacterized protein NAEGRDRAFT_80346 [Naegleria gruberi]EFC42741.1 hypothetical protein NAEGRDRAFT_80346 [Naegleria gruberi]|eukprot:XP_002675485.1 hypothetical protein NAEGRDRAFT_80346 [Naegleria gruberi strain NEG-M]